MGEYNIAELLILALDTSSAAGSAALIRDGTILIEQNGDGTRTHGERLPLELMAMLRDARASLHDVNRFAVATGPGSFTGLRVGIASIQGLALARGAPVTPVSTFEALAFHARGRGAIAVWIDARRGEVFATLYAADGRTVLEPPSSLSPEATLDAWADALVDHPDPLFVGDGAVRYAGALRARVGPQSAVATDVPPLAGSIGLIAAAEPDRAVSPHALVPLYVRRPDAELARDRRQVKG